MQNAVSIELTLGKTGALEKICNLAAGVGYGISTWLNFV